MDNKIQINLEHDNSYKFVAGKSYYHNRNYKSFGDTFVIETSQRTDKLGRIDTENYAIEPTGSMKWVYFIGDTPKFKEMTKKQIIQMFMNEIKLLKQQVKTANEHQQTLLDAMETWDESVESWVMKKD